MFFLGWFVGGTPAGRASPRDFDGGRGLPEEGIAWSRRRGGAICHKPPLMRGERTKRSGE